MNRKEMLAQIQDPSNTWDLIIIGGGASGLGAGLDAVSRGLRTLVLEQGDFAQATSSRSTKLVHGGVRYLRQGEIRMVRGALQERAFLLQNAPHLVHPLPFILPTTSWFKQVFYYVGIKLYDLLAGKLKFENSRCLSKIETLKYLPGVNPQQLQSSVCYHDGQFDDSRLAINLAQSIVDHQGTVLNYMQVNGLLKNSQQQITGVICKDLENQKEYQITGKCVINATGVFVDAIRRMDNAAALDSIIPSQGAHIVLDRSFFPGTYAMIIPETTDGRVLFAIPWHNKVIIGTTDTSEVPISMEPRPLAQEIDYLLEYAGKFLLKQPTSQDILSTFAGLRPLVKPNGNWKKTSSLPRDYVLTDSPSQLITVTGGKWTTYRKMGEDTVNLALKVTSLPQSPSKTKNLAIHGWVDACYKNDEWSYYGSDQVLVEQLAAQQAELLIPLHPNLPCRPVDVLWAVRHEMARRIEDVLARRTRCLFLDAKASMQIAPQVAELMSQFLEKDNAWKMAEVEAYRQLATGYLDKRR